MLKCHYKFSWLQLLVYKLFIFKFDYKAPKVLFYCIQACIKVLQIKVTPFEKCLSMMTVARQIDASDEIHERRVNPGSGVGKLLRQDLK